MTSDSVVESICVDEAEKLSQAIKINSTIKAHFSSVTHLNIIPRNEMESLIVEWYRCFESIKVPSSYKDYLIIVLLVSY